jgi:hypothetical protein
LDGIGGKLGRKARGKLERKARRGKLGGKARRES